MYYGNAQLSLITVSCITLCTMVEWVDQSNNVWYIICSVNHSCVCSMVDRTWPSAYSKVWGDSLPCSMAYRPRSVYNNIKGFQL